KTFYTGSAETFAQVVEMAAPALVVAAGGPRLETEADVLRMAEAVRQVLGREAKPAGIGGGTVAAFFRRMGIPAVVWGRNEGQAHQPNEYCVIANMVGNAKVYAHLCGQL
ncbi:MAG: M20/M25/M40 family metallo-hydrolase, partial [candidate division WOR-3 bacterium]